MRRYFCVLLFCLLTACGTSAVRTAATKVASVPIAPPGARLTNVVTSLPGQSSKFCVGATCFAAPAADLLQNVQLGDCVSVTVATSTDNQAANLATLDETAGCDAVGQPYPPYQTTLPRTWPKAHVVGHYCELSAPAPSAWYPAQLPASTDSATLLWYSGNASHTCNSAVTELTASQARLLLTDLHQAKGPNLGATYHCPMDDSRYVQAWFQTGTTYRSIRIALAGCAFYEPHNPADLGDWPAFIHPRT